nr:MAG TPA: hypothetical protein [Caudoviricetes sp.]
MHMIYSEGLRLYNCYHLMIQNIILFLRSEHNQELMSINYYQYYPNYYLRIPTFMSGTWEEHSRRKINRRIENSTRKNFNKKRLPGDFGSRFWERCRMCHAPH